MFQRHRIEIPPHARLAVAAASGRAGFNGLSEHRPADNDARVHHTVHPAVTAVIAGAVTAENVTAENVTACHVTSITANAVTAITAAIVTPDNVTAGNVRAVTAPAVTTITAATVTVFTSTTGIVTAGSFVLLGAAAGVWPYPLEDDPVFRHAKDALLAKAGGAASSSPVEIDEAFSDNSEFLSMMDKTAMLSMLGPRGTVDAGRRKDRRPWMTAVGALMVGAASSCPPLWRTAEKMNRLGNPGGYLGLRRRR